MRVLSETKDLCFILKYRIFAPGAAAPRAREALQIREAVGPPKYGTTADVHAHACSMREVCHHDRYLHDKMFVECLLNLGCSTKSWARLTKSCV